MRKLYYILTILFLLTDFSVFGQTGTIKGQVYNRKEKHGFSKAFLWLLDTKINITTDINGNFIIDSVLIGTYSLQASFPGFGDTTVTNLKIKSDTTIQVNIVLPPSCQYDKNEINNTCPLCGKKNKVLPIAYGFPVGQDNSNKYYYKGCTFNYCKPHWYCKRDKYEF
jgi:hypothetical protein